MNERFNVEQGHKEKLEENFLSHIGYEHTQNLCKELDSQKEEWENVEIPESFDQWFQGFHKKHVHQIKRKDKMLTLVKRIAIFLFFFLGVNAFLYSHVEAYRVYLLDSFVQIGEKFTQIDMVSKRPDYLDELSGDWTGKYLPFYLPKGYTVVESTDNSLGTHIVFQNEKDKIVDFRQMDIQMAHQVDSENGNVKTITINGWEAYLFDKNGAYTLYWLLEDDIIRIEANRVDEKTMIKMVENVRTLKK